MFKNFLLTALRNFWKYKVFSLINIIGLATSLAVCFLLILILKDAYSYDTFSNDTGRIYRVNTEAIRKEGGRELYASSPLPVASSIKTNYPVTEATTSIVRGLNGEIISGDKKFEIRGFYTDPSFFNVFGFTLREGNATQALKEPFSIILTEKLAKKLFPAGNAIGKTVEVSHNGLYKVTGILHEFPGKTHLEFEVLSSLVTVPALEKSKALFPVSNEWTNYYSSYTYLKLKPGITSSKVEKILAGISGIQYKNLKLETRDKGYRFLLQPLDKITPGPLISNGMGKGLPKVIIGFMGMLALIIILFAAFNYTNLTVAKAMTRMKEIALRKVIGSRRVHIFFQILSESIITALLAFGAGLVLVQWMIPKINSVSFIAEAGIRFDIDGRVILLFIAFAIFTGIIAGIIPATLLSRIKPLMLLNKLQNFRLFRHIGMRKVILVFQFMISMVLITLVTINYKQMQYAININFGNNRSNIYNLDLQGQDYQEMINKIKQVPGVEKISAISHLMGNYNDRSDDVRLTKDKDPVTVREYFTDENYTSQFNLPLVAGKNFASNTGQKFETELIVNETFVSHFKLGTPSEAIGKPVVVGDSTNLIIRGVVKDFLFRPAEYAPEPMMMRYNPGNCGILNISITPGNTMQTVSKIENIWKQSDPVHPIQGRFYNQEVQSIFSDMKDAIWIIAFIAFIGIMISCLGLLGITIFTVQSKAKEISIRKVVGAGAMDITKLLSRNYVQVILMAVLIAIPVAYYLGAIILNSMHQHIPMSAGLFIPGMISIFLLSSFTIAFQTIKAILSNPADDLRSE